TQGRLRYCSSSGPWLQRHLRMIAHGGEDATPKPPCYGAVPVGRCNAVFVRCATSHFERPVQASASVRRKGGHVVGRPSKYDIRCVCSVIGRSLRSQVSSAAGTSALRSR